MISRRKFLSYLSATPLLLPPVQALANHAPTREVVWELERTAPGYIPTIICTTHCTQAEALSVFKEQPLTRHAQIRKISYVKGEQIERFGRVDYKREDRKVESLRYIWAFPKHRLEQDNDLATP